MSTGPQVIRLAIEDLEWMTELLTDAFLDKAPTTHLFTGPRRALQTRYFMRCSCAYALLFGECYSTADRQGVALWLLPGSTTMSPGRMYKAGMLSAPFHMGALAFSRFMGFAGHTDRMHRIAAPMHHYYLFALGVAPAAQGKGFGGHLVRSMLDCIDGERMPAYLETQEPRNIDLYKRLGFAVAVEESFPRLEGLTNWGMFRASGGSRRRE